MIILKASRSDREQDYIGEEIPPYDFVRFSSWEENAPPLEVCLSNVEWTLLGCPNTIHIVIDSHPLAVRDHEVSRHG